MLIFTFEDQLKVQLFLQFLTLQFEDAKILKDVGNLNLDNTCCM